MRGGDIFSFAGGSIVSGLSRDIVESGSGGKADKTTPSRGLIASDICWGLELDCIGDIFAETGEEVGHIYISALMN